MLGIITVKSRPRPTRLETTRYPCVRGPFDKRVASMITSLAISRDWAKVSLTKCRPDSKLYNLSKSSHTKWSSRYSQSGWQVRHISHPFIKSMLADTHTSNLESHSPAQPIRTTIMSIYPIPPPRPTTEYSDSYAFPISQ